MASASPRSRAVPPRSRVVDLARARDARRLREFETRCRTVDDLNRRALSRLFQSGLVFTRAGARLGRDLLLAHQHLLRVGDLLVRIGALGEEGWNAEADALYDEALELLSRTTRLTARTGLVLARGT
jgi:phosphate uptake regulator